MKLKLKKSKDDNPYTTYPKYQFFLDNKPILLYNAPKKAIVLQYKRYKSGLKNIPPDATILPTRKDRLLYDKKILGGWVCKKQGFTYGIYIAAIDKILTNSEECLYWSLGKSEIEKFTNYDIKEEQKTEEKPEEKKDKEWVQNTL